MTSANNNNNNNNDDDEEDDDDDDDVQVMRSGSQVSNSFKCLLTSLLLVLVEPVSQEQELSVDTHTRARRMISF